MSKTLVKRILISMLIGIAIGAATSEIAFLFLRETARAPKEIVLTIPAGTAEQVARGEQPPALPESMVFVVGDVLIIKNEDTVDHQMRLALSVEENLAYECSFQTTKYIGLEVREPVTLGTRVFGILFAGIPLGILIALYSLIIPTRKKQP
jgi:hypothetical protein